MVISKSFIKKYKKDGSTFIVIGEMLNTKGLLDTENDPTIKLISYNEVAKKPASITFEEIDEIQEIEKEKADVIDSMLKQIVPLFMKLISNITDKGSEGKGGYGPFSAVADADILKEAILSKLEDWTTGTLLEICSLEIHSVFIDGFLTKECIEGGDIDDILMKGITMFSIEGLEPDGKKEKNAICRVLFTTNDSYESGQVVKIPTDFAKYLLVQKGSSYNY